MLIRNQTKHAGNAAGNTRHRWQGLEAARWSPLARTPVAHANNEDPRWRADKDNLLRRFAFFMAVAFVFVRFSMIHEILTFHFGITAYLPWIFGVPAILGMLLSGGIRRTFRLKPAYFWTAFALWLIIATPFSFWRGGSVDLLRYYFKTEFPMLFLLAGLPVDWRECRQMMSAIALSGLVNVAIWHWFIRISEGRLFLEFGSMANANDFAAHLLVVLPFLLFIVLAGERRWFLKATALGLIAAGVSLVVSTGSRGGLLALMASLAFVLLRSSGRVRVAVLVIAPLIALLAILTVPKYSLERQATLFTKQDLSDEQAQEISGSTQRRLYLLRTSLQYTLEHPLFGVGPGQFLDYEGATAVQSGRRGAWQVTHNSYAQISSEAGVPALFFLFAALVSTYLLLNKTYRRARTAKEHQSIAMAAFCIMLSFIGFCVSILFLSLIYKFYLPVLSGLAISLASAAEREFAPAPHQTA